MEEKDGLVWSESQSSESSFPNVGLCLVSLRDSFSVGIRWTGGGAPIKSRAIDFTAFVALNFFFLRLVT